MEEVIVVPSVEDLMTWPPKKVDPWNRMTALEHDCFIVVEFSEVEGPRPALLIPSCPGEHFDQNAFSLWLMTSDYQQTNKTPFSLTKDIQVLLHNEEQGVDSYAHYFTLYDIEARGFVRPFSIAYLTKETGLLSSLFLKLRKDIGQVLEELKACNRRLFMRELAQAIDTLNSVENQVISFISISYE